MRCRIGWASREIVQRPTGSTCGVDDSLEALGVLNDDTHQSCERRIVCARATSWSDASSGEILLDATAGSDAGIDRLSPANMPLSPPSRRGA